jgi:UDPglucose 6-dehydrogenase
VGADVALVRKGVGSDDRIGTSFQSAGCGYGGSCFPKDVKALVRTLNESGVDAGILEAVERVNEAQKSLLLDYVEAQFGSDLSGRTFGVWGLSFKPETDDMREAPAITIVNGLLGRGARVRVHDPEAMDVARGAFRDKVTYCGTNYDAANGADALLIVTEWKQYRTPDFERMRTQMKEPVIFDGRNLFDPDLMARKGFIYRGIGRAGPRNTEGSKADALGGPAQGA